MFTFGISIFHSMSTHFVCKSFGRNQGCNHIDKMHLSFIEISIFLCLEAFRKFVFKNNFPNTKNYFLNHTYFFK